MKTDNFVSEFDGWLNAAVGPLPLTEQQMLRSELTAHYADAVQAQLANGVSALDAHRLAMRDLGDPEKAAEAMRQVYSPRGQYRTAALLSQSFALMIIGKLLFERLFGAAPILSIFSFLLLLSQPPCLIFILQSFKRLAVPAGVIDQPIAALSWVLASWDVVFFVGASFEGTSLPDWVRVALIIYHLVTALALAIFLIWFSMRLSSIRLKSNSLQKPLSYLSFLSGITVVGVMAVLGFHYLATIILGSDWAHQMLSLVDVPIAAGVVLYSIFGACWTWLFVQASRRPQALSPI